MGDVSYMLLCLYRRYQYGTLNNEGVGPFRTQKIFREDRFHPEHHGRVCLCQCGIGMEDFFRPCFLSQHHDRVLSSNDVNPSVSRLRIVGQLAGVAGAVA